MINKKIIIPIAIFATAILSIGVFYSSLNEPYVYVQSDITKANPKILIGNNIFDTAPNVSYVKDSVVLTAIGEITKVGDPVTKIIPPGEMYSFVPVTMKVSDYSKNNVNVNRGDNITIHLTGDRYGDFYLHTYQPRFEIGENVLVHLENYEHGVNGSDGNNYYASLGELGKYRIVGGMAYNENHINGTSISNALKEALDYNVEYDTLD